MDKIRLYKPLPCPKLPSQLHLVHWEDLARQLERRAHEFFNLPRHMGVLAVDRATHGIGVAAMYMSAMHGARYGYIPSRTYRAARDALLQVGVLAGTTEKEGPQGWLDRPELPRDTVLVPTTLGGVAMDADHFEEDVCVIYDCAHTCHPDMFTAATGRMNQRHVAVLSFYPTKPCGAFGGGLVVGTRGTIEWMRERAWPVEMDTCSTFCYPQSVQSWGMINRLHTFNASYWKEMGLRVEALVALIQDRLGIEPVWPCETPLTAHLLTFDDRIEELKAACEKACLETGSHYPSVHPKKEGRPHLSLPFHTNEVIDRLKEVL